MDEGQRIKLYSGLIPAFLAWSNCEYGYFPLDGMLVHRRVIPQQYVAGTIYTPEVNLIKKLHL